MDYPGDAWRVADSSRSDLRPLFQRGPTRSTSRRRLDRTPRQALDVGTLGLLGIGMVLVHRIGNRNRQPVARGRGRQRVGFFRMEVRDHLPLQSAICISHLHNDGISAAPTSIRPGSYPAPYGVPSRLASRDRQMIAAFGFVGFNATTPDELKRAASGDVVIKPTLIQRGDRPAPGAEVAASAHLNPQSHPHTKCRHNPTALDWPRPGATSGALRNVARIK